MEFDRSPRRRAGRRWLLALLMLFLGGAVLGLMIRVVHTTEEQSVAALKVGDRAPDFSATTGDGTPVRLADFLGKRALVLFFYPKDGTSICTAEACAFRDSYDKFVQAGADVIGVSSDDEASHQSFAKEHKLSFPLISDAKGELRKTFAVPKTLGLFPGRVTYVIDKEGIIRQIFSSQFASDEHVRQALTAVESSTAKTSE
jgi:peroxiredoxin Q/BCP